MKKTNMVGVVAAFTIASTFVAVPVMAQSGEITESQAKQIALSNAGLKEKDVVFVRSGLDFDDGIKQYEIEFYCGNMEYDYDIDAVSGAILSVDQDCEYYAPAAQNAQAAAPAKASGITQEQALDIALKLAGVAKKDAAYINVYPDYEDGRACFDVTFFVGATEYHYDIDSASGQIIEADVDIEDGDMDFFDD